MENSQNRVSRLNTSSKNWQVIFELSLKKASKKLSIFKTLFRFSELKMP